MNILSVYDHFHWRYVLAPNNHGATGYKGLSTDPKWMESYLTANNMAELKSMLGATAKDAGEKSGVQAQKTHLRKPVHH